MTGQHPAKATGATAEQIDAMRETDAVLADPETMAAIVEAEAETGQVSPALRQAADDAWDAQPCGPHERGEIL